MKILIVSQTYFPFLREGGRPTKVRAIAEGLSALGHDVVVLTSQLGPFVTPDGSEHVATAGCRYGRTTTRGGVEIIYLRAQLRRRTATLSAEILNYCAEKIADFDLVHVFGIYDFIGPVAAWYSKARGIPYLVETMGMFPPLGRSRLPKRLWHRWVGKHLVDGAARIIASSERERDELTRYGVRPDRITVRRNGVSAPPPTGEPGSFRRRYRIPMEAPIALFLARVVPEKGPELLLRAFARVRRADETRPWRLILAGPCEEAYQRRLRNLASSLQISDRVLFIPGLYGEGKWSAIRDASFVVHPSSGESFGNSIAEAIACGTPVIATDRCGIVQLLAGDPQMPGLVVPHDEQILAAERARLGSDAKLHGELVVGCERILPRLGWAEPLAQLERIYNDLAAAAQAGSTLNPWSSAKKRGSTKTVRAAPGC